MRLLIAGIVNLLRLVLALIALPLRLLGGRSRPHFIQYRLEGDPPYRGGRRRGLLSLRKRPEPSTVTSVAELEAQLRRLAQDPKIEGVLFDFEGLTVSPAKREAIAGLIRTFRTSGKKAIGFAVTASTGEYPLLCELDQVLMPSAGRLDLTGYAAEATAAGAAFRRFGLGAHFIRRGEHKTAPELFTEDHVSPNVRGLLSRLLEERYQHLVDAISARRGLSAEAVRQKIDRGPYSARRALAEGLCDAIVSEAELPEFLRTGGVTSPPFERRTAPPPAAEKKAKPSEEEDGAKRLRLASYGVWARQQPFSPKWMPVRGKPRVGLIKIEGMIVSGEGGRGIGSFAGAKSVVKALRSAARDPRVASVLLYVNSGGGSAVAPELILEEARRLQRRKPVVAYFDRVAASGGYMAMLGADEIWGGPLSLVGSIGVFAGKFEAGELLRRLGVEREVIAFGQNAGLLSTTRPFTDSERAALELEIQETYEAFLDLVGAARGMTREEVHARGEGRVYSAQLALEQRLVDRVGGFDEACRRALALSGETRGDYEVLPFAAGPRRLGGLSAGIRELAQAQVWALWDQAPAFPELAGSTLTEIP